MLAANCRRGGALLCGRLYSSALNGNRSPLENVTKSSNPMLHQEDSTSRSTEDALEMRVPGNDIARPLDGRMHI